MIKPLLSICIPTYNRSEYLKKTIESIIVQKEFINKEIEIVISDNASTDNTKDMASYYAARYDNFFYYCNEKNISNENFPLVLSRGNGVLRRLCNDTLCFKPDSLNYICEIIKKYKQERPFICWLGLGTSPFIEEFNFRDGIKMASYWITSIACFSIWDSECNEIESDIYGAELLLWQVRKTLELASKKNRILLVNKSITFSQSVKNKDISYGLYQVFYENYFTLLNPYFESEVLIEDDKEFLEKDLLLNFFPYWCATWKLQNASLQYSKSEDLYNLVYQQYHFKPYWKEFEKIYKKIYYKLHIKEITRKILDRV